MKGIDKKEKNIKEFFNNFISKGSIANFNSNNVFVGSELAYNLNLKIGDSISLMSSTFIATPFGTLPKQENFKISGIFNTGFIEYDQNVIFLNINDSLSLFDKDYTDLNLRYLLKIL